MASEQMSSYFKTFNDKIRPFVQPIMFGYLAYFYVEVSMTTVDTQPANAQLSNQTLGAMNQYGMIVALLAALLTLATFVATWFDDKCETNAEKAKEAFGKKLERSVNPLVMASIYQLLAIYVVGHSQGLPRYGNAESDEHGAESVAAGVITLLACLTVYMSVDPEQGQTDIPEAKAQPIVPDPDTGQDVIPKLTEAITGKSNNHDELACKASGLLVLAGWSYNVARGVFVGPWYEAFTVMLLCVLANLGLSRAGVGEGKVSPSLSKGLNLIVHVFMTYFLARDLGDNADNVVALGLVIASAVLNVSTSATSKERVNAQLHWVAKLLVRLTHIAVAVVAWAAVDRMSADDDQVLHSLIRVGALLKIIASCLPVSHLELLARNGSTLLLLIPFASLYADDNHAIQMAAFWLTVVARVVDAIQNTILKDPDSFLLGDLGSVFAERLTAKPEPISYDNPVIYVVLAGLITTSVGLVASGNEACADGILDPGASCSVTERKAMCMRVAIGLVWTHTLTALLGTVLSMFKDNEDAEKAAGWLSPSTLELFRTAVATSVLGLVSYASHQGGDSVAPGSLIGSWLYISLFAYIFVDTVGRNVV